LWAEQDRKKKKKKTTLRTLRLTEELDELLAKIASEKHTTLNALVTSVLTRYVEWDRFSEDFDLVSIQRQVLRSILEATIDERLSRIATKYGSDIPKEGVMYWFKELDQETFVAGLSNIFRYGRLAHLQVDTKHGERIMVARHGLGPAGSKFLKEFIGAAALSILGKTPDFELTADTILIRLPPS
jgi:hypothetical protein